MPAQPTIRTSALAAVIAAQAQAQAQERAKGRAAAQTASNASPVESAPASNLSPAPVPTPSPSPSLTPSLTPSPALVPPPDELRSWASACTDATVKLRNSFVTLAYYGAKLISADNWAALGNSAITSEDSFRESLGVGRKLWREAMTLGRRIQHLPLDSLSGMTLATAQQLAVIHPSVWPEYAWLDEARMLTPAEFAELVEERNREAVASGAQGIQVVEPTSSFSFQLPRSQHRDLQRRMLRLQRLHRHKTMTETLEAVVAAMEQADLIADRQAEIEGLVREVESIWLDTDLAAESADRSALAAGQRTVSLLGRLRRHLKEV